MLGILRAILCAIENLAYFLLSLVVDGINAIILGIAAIITGLLALMPDMPTLPSMPSEFTTVLSWIAWILPVGTIVDILTFAIAAWLLWQVVLIALRWAKATDE